MHFSVIFPGSSEVCFWCESADIKLDHSGPRVQTVWHFWLFLRVRPQEPLTGCRLLSILAPKNEDVLISLPKCRRRLPYQGLIPASGKWLPNLRPQSSLHPSPASWTLCLCFLMSPWAWHVWSRKCPLCPQNLASSPCFPFLLLTPHWR